MKSDHLLGGGTKTALRASLYSIPLGVFASASGYLTNWILGRVSPELLGAYTGILTLAGMIATVSVLGGTNVPVHFATGLRNSQSKRFMSRYAFVCLLGASVGVAGALVLRASGILLPRVFEGVPALPLVALVVGLTLVNVANGGLLSQMKLITVAGIACVLSATVLMACVLLWVGNALHVRTVYGLVAVIYLLVGVVSWLISRGPWPSPGRSLRRGWPEGFWRYVLPLHASTIVVFLAGNFDVLVVGTSGLAALGVYKVVILARTLARWLPGVVHPPLYPVLRRSVVDHDSETAEGLVRLYARLDGVAALFIAVTLVAGARFFVGSFGEGYAAAIPAVILTTAISGSLYPVTLIAGTVLVAEGMMWQSLTINAISLATGWVAGGLLYGRAGFLGISLAVGLSTAVACGLQLLVLNRIGWRIPIKWAAVSIACLAVSCVVVATTQDQMLGVVGALTATTGLALATRMVTIDDLKRVVRGARARRAQRDDS